jgi:hypothetical protein
MPSRGVPAGVIKEDHGRFGEIFRSMHVRSGHVRLGDGTAIALGFCRSGFMTFLPISSLEQYRCGFFVGVAQIAQGVAYQGIRRTRGFTWFEPPERNTLRPRVNGVVLLCLSARLRSSLFSPSVRACGVRPAATVVCPDLL